MSIAIYTAITNGYEADRDDIQVYKGENQFTSPVMEAKIYKVLSHLYTSADISIWVDGNIFPKLTPEEMVEKYLKDADMCVLEHPYRKYLSEELQALRYVQRLRTSYKFMANIGLQDTHYKRTGNPFARLYECGVIIRRNTEAVRRFNEQWWAEICRWTERDQLSFAYLMDKNTDIILNTIPGNVRNHQDFTYTKLH